MFHLTVDAAIFIMCARLASVSFASVTHCSCQVPIRGEQAHIQGNRFIAISMIPRMTNAIMVTWSHQIISIRHFAYTLRS